MSQFLSLGERDFVNGLVVTLFAAAFTTFYSVTQQEGFNIFTVEWTPVLGNVVNVSVIAVMSYLAKNFLTNSNGEFMKGEN